MAMRWLWFSESSFSSMPQRDYANYIQLFTSCVSFYESLRLKLLFLILTQTLASLFSG